MFSTETLAVTCGLTSALAWGASGFCGGLATRRGNVLTVIVFSQLIGTGLLLIFSLLFAKEMPEFHLLSIGGIAGICGTFGLVAFYRGLALGRMGIVAPISAIVTAVIPVLFAIFNEGLPKTTKLYGFSIALVSVWFLSHTTQDSKIRFNELYLPVLAGFGFSLFLILIDQVSNEAILWPLFAGRLSSVSLMTLILLKQNHPKVPAYNQLFFIALAGISETGGSGFFALATRLGRLDISTVLGALYPAVTVLLARYILKERLLRGQWVGVMIALCALVLISI